MKHLIVLISLTLSTPCLASTNELREAKIESYLRSITVNAAEYQRVDNILGDTVLEGDACDRLYRGQLTKRCNAELKAQVSIERAH